MAALSLSVVTVACVLLCLVLIDSTQGGSSCCTSYTRSPVPFHRITGFKNQSMSENCHIDAIIFYTVKRNQICATIKDEWVRRNLKLLSAQLKKMANKRLAAQKNKRKRA